LKCTIVIFFFTNLPWTEVFFLVRSGDSGFVIWLTGLPGSGKTTMAKFLENELRNRGLKVETLDGDEVRRNLSPDLGFSKIDREVHAKRVTYVSLLLSRNGVISIVALISPFLSSRDYARNLIGRFVEVWVRCSVETCRKRDPKGLYKQAQEGKVSNLTGMQDPYEPPINPEVIIDTEHERPDACGRKIIASLKDLKYLD
jgi:adenylylsulfate kinase